MERLNQHLHTQANEWDWIQWRGVRKTIETTAWVVERGQFRLTGETPDFYVPLPASWAELNARLSRNMKEAIRKAYNAMARDGHQFEFRVIDTPEQVPDAVAVFIDLHTARANLAGTVDHINAFATPHDQEFLHHIALQHAKQGQFRAFQLVIADTVVATRLAFVCGDELYLYFSGYLPQWGKYSAMTTVVVEIMKWAIAHELKIVNLSFGSDRSKLRWRPESCEYIGGFTLSPNRQAHMLWPAFSAAWRRFRYVAPPTPQAPE
jgi:CelD/BcsL family acetyltransferase involved in cellulose biosynthesis